MNAVLGTLLWMTVTASAMILAVFAVRALFSKKMSPLVMLLLWALVLARLCLPVTFASPVHLDGLWPSNAATEKAINEPQTLSPNGYSPQAPMHSTGIAPHTPPAAPQENAAPPLLQSAAALVMNVSLWDCLTGAWAAGALAVLLAAWRRAARFRKKLRVCRPVTDSGILRAIRRFGLEAGIRAEIPVLECDFVEVPAVFGCIRPKLLLPELFLKKMNKGRLNAVLLHEICHIRSRDTLVNCLWLLAKAAHWFNPFVWAAYRQYRGDVEIRRDQMVARNLDRSSRLEYSQSLIDSARYAGRNRFPETSVTASLFTSKSKVRERVLRLVAPQKRSRSSALAAATLAMLMVFACFTTACQPTPTRPIVKNKDGSDLENAIKATASPTPGLRGTQGAPAQTPAPKRVIESFKGADESVSINIDAQVTEPGVAMPVIEARPRAITMEQVKAMANVLLKGEKTYEPASMTKSGLQREILNLKKIIADDASLLKYYDGNREDADLAKKEYEKQIAAYEEMLPSAPETASRKETDWAFHPESYYNPQKTAKGQQPNRCFIAAGMSGDYRTFIQAFNMTSDEAESHLFGFALGKDLWDDSFMPKWRYADDKPGRMTRGEAIALATDTLGQMGLGDYELVSCKAERSPKAVDKNLSLQGALDLTSSYMPTAAEPPDEEACSYYMEFASSYEGVPMLETGQNMDQDQYGPVYFYESLRIRVRDGLIANFDWQDPLETVRVENANAAILPLEKAVEAFKKQMQFVYTLDHLLDYSMQYSDFAQKKSQIKAGTVRITNVQLGLMRVRVKDKPNTFRLMPAWMFSGTEQFTVKNAEAPLEGMRSRGGLYAYAVINAIDGSIIDPSLGY